MKKSAQVAKESATKLADCKAQNPKYPKTIPDAKRIIIFLKAELVYST